MNEFLGQRLSDWLDGDESGSVDGSEPLDEQSRRELAESLLIHGLLKDFGRRNEQHDAIRLDSLMRTIDDEHRMLPFAVQSASQQATTRHQFAYVSSALAVSVAILAMIFALVPQQNVSAAMASLEKVLEAATKRLDRTYVVRLVEEYPRDKRPQNITQEAWDREAPEQIDGVTIYVRGPNEYVMTVLLKTGVTRTSGCDGQLSWSFRENGPVHVSTDLNRFRGGMPGNQQDMPFVNIHANLSQLKVGYDVELTDNPEMDAEGTSLLHLTCVRKSIDVRGAKQVDIWFDAEDGTVHKMLLDGLPRGRGGPKSVMLELVDQSELVSNFFSHESHHEPARKVKIE